MIIIHIESGLGNQMLSYCEYLSLKYANPCQKFYLETIVYEIPECHNFICQWNGYELHRIFGINEPQNIKTLFSKDEWECIIREIKETEFWKHNWNYPVFFTSVFKKHGLILDNVRGNFDTLPDAVKPNIKRRLIDWFKDSRLGYEIRKLYQRYNESEAISHTISKDKLFARYDHNVFTGQWLKFCYRNNDRYLIEREIRRVFVFPPFQDDKNIQLANYLSSVNAVAIHVRRGDMAKTLNWCFKYGYYKNAVNIIRRKVSNPVFVIFSTKQESEWCRNNASTLGLSLKNDIVKIIDWNDGNDSFRDMQLMGLCKHAVITTSSFGWWGGFFIRNPEKIVVSARIALDTTHHC